MIHQLNRKNDEAASAYLQHLQEDRPRNFTVCDADGWIYKRDAKLARFVEHKCRGDRVQVTTREILVIQSEMIRRSVGIGKLHPQSGVFIVYSDPPFVSASIEPIDPWGILIPPEEMTGRKLEIFETGQPFPDGRRWETTE